MTKPITAAGVMALIEDTQLHLDECVDRLLPELATSPNPPDVCRDFWRAATER